MAQISVKRENWLARVRQRFSRQAKKTVNDTAASPRETPQTPQATPAPIVVSPETCGHSPDLSLHKAAVAGGLVKIAEMPPEKQQPAQSPLPETPQEPKSLPQSTPLQSHHSPAPMVTNKSEKSQPEEQYTGAQQPNHETFPQDTSQYTPFQGQGPSKPEPRPEPSPQPNIAVIPVEHCHIPKANPPVVAAKLAKPQPRPEPTPQPNVVVIPAEHCHVPSQASNKTNFPVAAAKPAQTQPRSQFSPQKPVPKPTAYQAQGPTRPEPRLSKPTLVFVPPPPVIIKERTAYEALALWQPDKYIYDPHVPKSGGSTGGTKSYGYGSNTWNTRSTADNDGIRPTYESSQDWLAPSDISSTRSMGHYFSPSYSGGSKGTCYSCLGSLDYSAGAERCNCR